MPSVLFIFSDSIDLISSFLPKGRFSQSTPPNQLQIIKYIPLIVRTGKYGSLVIHLVLPDDCFILLWHCMILFLVTTHKNSYWVSTQTKEIGH
jgi:hypothetical protein